MDIIAFDDSIISLNICELSIFKSFLSDPGVLPYQGIMWAYLSAGARGNKLSV